MKYTSLNDFLHKCGGHCYIYGGGVWGYYVLKYIFTKVENITVDAILVSDFKKNSDNIFGIPIKIVDTIKDIQDASIIVAANEMYSSEIENTLKLLGCEEVYVITKEEYKTFRRIAPDIFPEIRQDLRIVRGDVIGNINYVGDKVVRKLSDEIDPSRYKYGGIYYQDNTRYKKDFELLAKEPEKLKEKINALVYNMEYDSVFEVYRIIDRLHKLINDLPIVFCEEEKSELKQSELYFRDRVFKLTDGMYSYKNYLFPVKNPSLSSVWDEHGMKNFRCLEKIRDKDIIDAGGYIGDSALILSKYTDGKIYSFEADEHNIELINKTIELNKADKIVPVYAALTDHAGYVEFYEGENVEESAFGGGTITDKCSSFTGSTQTKTVPSITVDQYVKENGLKIGLIKTDVEGGEPWLLKGAIETIRTQKPALLISIYHNLGDFFDIKPWLESLDLGYRFKIFRSVVHISFMTETVLLCEADAE